MAKENSAQRSGINQEDLPINPEDYKAGLTEALEYLAGNRKPLNFIISYNSGLVSLSLFERGLSPDESFFFTQVANSRYTKVSMLDSENPFLLTVSDNRSIFDIVNELLSCIRCHYTIAANLPIRIYNSLEDAGNNTPLLKITELGKLVRPKPLLVKPERHYQLPLIPLSNRF